MDAQNCDDKLDCCSQAAKQLRGFGAAVFWQRADVEAARKTVDLWASLKRARLAGVDGCPTADAIFSRAVPTVAPWLDKRTGLWVTDEELFVRTSTFRELPPPRVAEMSLDRLFQELGTPRLAVSLLYFLYPRSGPYEQDGELANFRPSVLFGRLQGRYLTRARVAFFGQLHREMIAQIVAHGTHRSIDSETVEGDLTPMQRGSTNSRFTTVGQGAPAEAR